jgi:class 3 adenylate cyclase
MRASPQPQPDEPLPRSAARWRALVRDAERRGELLAAFDLAEQGLEAHPDDVVLKHGAVLALARAGSTGEAARHFKDYGLAGEQQEDVAALAARIAKDRALAVEGARRRELARESAELYGAVYRRSGGYYPAINEATLRLIAGDRKRARRLADEVLSLVGGQADADYYAAASKAEAELLLGDLTAARAPLERTAQLHRGDHGALATTRRQLLTICEAAGLDAAILDPLRGPEVVHFCGHRLACEHEAGRFPRHNEADVLTRVRAEVERYRPAYAYGALAGGADILWAEALLEHGVELHVVLPFAREEFVRSSVAPSGEQWVERFEHCMEMATRVTYATEDAYLGDDVLYRYGAELAMGLALLHARYLASDARQLAVWDGSPALGDAGTAIDIETWRHTGWPVSVVSPRSDDGPRLSAPRHASQRVVRAILFADVRGFAKLSDEQLPRFNERVIGAFADVLARLGGLVLYRNTWGDSLYVVLADAPSAAACACDLQEAMSAIDLQDAGLPPHLALRMGGHLGPVFATRDPVLDLPSFMGSHVSRTARIEPVTPPGATYVTEPFAAALVLAGRDEFPCEYVGHMPMAKDYGRLRMYRLLRRQSSEVRTRARVTSPH